MVGRSDEGSETSATRASGPGSALGPAAAAVATAGGDSESDALAYLTSAAVTLVETAAFSQKLQ